MIPKIKDEDLAYLKDHGFVLLGTLPVMKVGTA
jgi:hypothetical protein